MRSRGRHDPGRVVRDLAVMLADGGECLADLCGVRISSRCSGRSRGQGRHGASSACVSAVGGWVARDGGDCWHQARLSRKSVATPSAKSARRHRPF
jgi:hypothetical protein